MKLYDIVSHLINNLDSHPEGMYGLSFIDYIKEFRTIDLNLPRRSGKTTTISMLAKEKSCIVLTKYPQLLPNTKTFNSNNVIECLNRDNRFYNLRYQCILIDEECSSVGVFKLVGGLKLLDLLTKDFFVLKLGTKNG